MASDYIKMLEKRARQDMDSLNKGQQEAVVDAYRYAGRQLANGYKGSRSDTATRALYASYTKKIAEDTQAIIEEYSIKGARLYMDVEKLIMDEAFKRAGLDTSAVNDRFENIIGSLGKESVKNVIGGGIYKDGAGLSKRIWSSSKIAGRSIQEVVAAGLAQDMGAAKLSKLLQDYVNPTARKNWSTDKIRSLLGDGYASWNRNLEYNALRLARTTLAHTATMSMRQAKKINPYATKIRWHSVHAAGRTCETCEEMDGQVYETEKCPFDHPNGMCYQTHEMEKSLDEIADELAAWCNGEENEVLDNWWEGLTGEKPSDFVKEHILYNLMHRDILKDFAESHRVNINHQSDSHKSIYNEYIGTGNSFALNRHLRNLTDGQEIDNRYKKVVGYLDDAINQSKLSDNFKFRRFVDTNYLNGTFGSSDANSIGKYIGNVYRNKQYMSVTVDSNPCFENRPAVMTIMCEKGTHIFPTTNYYEGELILGRNIDYELIDAIDHSESPLTLEYEGSYRRKTLQYRGIEIIVKIIK